MKKFGIIKKAQHIYIVDDRNWMTCAAAPKVFTPKECKKIIGYWDEEKAVDAQTKTIGDASDVKATTSETRVGKIQWLNPHEDEYHWILTRLAQAAMQINNEAFGLIIDGMMDNMQLTRYLPGDKYHLHEDSANGLHRRRKLSFTLQLSDPKTFEGGGLAFHSGPVTKPGDQLGALAAFPSFLPHQALEVTKGERWALVGWFSGPEWR